MKEPRPVTIGISDVAGRLIRTLVDEFKAGSRTPYSAIWNGKDEAGLKVASGVYFSQTETKSFSSAKKIVALR